MTSHVWRLRLSPWISTKLDIFKTSRLIRSLRISIHLFIKPTLVKHRKYIFLPSTPSKALEPSAHKVRPRYTSNELWRNAHYIGSHSLNRIKHHSLRFCKPSGKMCRVVYYKSPTCEHRWFYIARRCGEKKGFNECDVFKPHGFLPHYVGSPMLAPPKQCPECDKDGKYDGNDTRMILEDSFGCEHWGMGESHVYKSRCVVL